MNQKNQEEWEKEFEDLLQFKFGITDCQKGYLMLKQFISSLLSKEREKYKRANYYGVGVLQYEEIINQGIELGVKVGKSEAKKELAGEIEKWCSQKIQNVDGGYRFIDHDDLLRFIKSL